VEALDALIWWWDHLAAAAVVFARVVGLLVTAPVFGRDEIPKEIKALLALALTMVLIPGQEIHLSSGVANGLAYAVLILRELGVGLMLGWLANCFFLGVMFGADLTGRIAGFAAAEIFDPSMGGMRGPIGEVFMIVLVLLFLLSNGHHSLIAGLARSYHTIPIDGLVIGDALAQVVVSALSHLFTIAITVAFPVLAVIMAVAMAEGVITRTIPQINILHITFAIKILMFLMVMHLGVPAAVAFLGSVVHALERFFIVIQPAFV
jgi:flagellar biosynthesis protein FliR